MSIALLSRALDRISYGMAVLGAGFLSFITLIIFLEILSRFFWDVSQIWVVEVSEYSLLYLTFLGAPWLVQHNRHVSIDLVVERFSPVGQSLATALIAVLGVSICAMATWHGITVLLDQIETGAREVTVLAPKSYWLTLIYPISFFVMALQFLLKFFEVFQNEPSTPPSQETP